MKRVHNLSAMACQSRMDADITKPTEGFRGLGGRSFLGTRRANGHATAAEGPSVPARQSARASFGARRAGRDLL
jgi:hypothetical protein